MRRKKNVEINKIIDALTAHVIMIQTNENHNDYGAAMGDLLGNK